MPDKFHFSVLFEVVNKATKPIKAVGRSISKLREPIGRTTEALKRMGRVAKEVGSKMWAVGKRMVVGLTGALVGAGLYALKASAEIETLETAFESMTGSAEKGREVVQGLIEFTAKTPFQLEGVGRAGKQLLSFGVSTENLQKKLQFLGDIAAGANVPLSDMAAIFGKSKAKGKAMTEELLQLSDRGIPIIDVLAKQMNVAKSEIFDMASKGKVSFDVLEKGLMSMTKKGGIFHKQMEKQSSTLAGLYSTLKDNVVLIFAGIGDKLVEAFNLKEHMKSLIAWMQKREVKEKLFSIIKGVANWINKLIDIMRPLGRSLLRVISAFSSSSKGGGLFLKVVEGIVWALNKAINAIGFLIYSIKALSLAWGDHDAELEATTRTYNAILKAAKKVKKRYDALKEKVGEKEAKKSPVYKQYMNIMKKLEREGREKNFLMEEKTDIYEKWKKTLDSFMGSSNSKAEVNIKVSADNGSTATIEKVKKVKGNTKISLMNDSYLGMTVPA